MVRTRRKHNPRGLDLNDDTWNSDAARQIESWGLIDALKDRHPDLNPVATCNKNTRNKPIDGIWSSPGINILQAGMTEFGSPDMKSMDHRLLWENFSAVNSIFGYRPPKPRNRKQNQRKTTKGKE
jgi:hypothetical protein